MQIFLRRRTEVVLKIFIFNFLWEISHYASKSRNISRNVINCAAVRVSWSQTIIELGFICGIEVTLHSSAPLKTVTFSLPPAVPSNCHRGTREIDTSKTLTIYDPNS